MDGCGDETPKKALFPDDLLEPPKNIRVQHHFDEEVTLTYYVYVVYMVECV